MPDRRAKAIGSEAVVAQLGEWWRGRRTLAQAGFMRTAAFADAIF